MFLRSPLFQVSVANTKNQSAVMSVALLILCMKKCMRLRAVHWINLLFKMHLLFWPLARAIGLLIDTVAPVWNLPDTPTYSNKPLFLNNTVQWRLTCWVVEELLMPSLRVKASYSLCGNTSSLQALGCSIVFLSYTKLIKLHSFTQIH